MRHGKGLRPTQPKLIETPGPSGPKATRSVITPEAAVKGIARQSHKTTETPEESVRAQRRTTGYGR